MIYAYLASEKPLTSHGIFSEVPTAPTRVEPTVLGHPWEGSRGCKQTHEQWLLNPCWLMISSGTILYYTTLYIYWGF